MKKSDKGKKVFGVIVIFAIIVAVFSGVVLAEDVPGGLKQSDDVVEIQTAVGNLSSEELTKAFGADQSCPIGPVLVSAKPVSSPRCYQCGDRTDDCFCNRENPCICCDNNCDGDCLDGCDGNCCWWAWDRACCLWGVGLKWCTNGGTWADKARSYEYRVSDTPEVGTIADGRSIPHVAWVVSVSEDKARVTVSEMNCWGICGKCSNPADPSNSVRTWEYSASVFEYIYPLTITTQSIYSSPASPGDELTFVYKIKNPSDRAVSNIRLGARIRTNSPQGSWIDDPTNDKVISVDPGEKDYSRKFRIPSDVSSGYYDAGWVIVNQNIDEYQVAEAWVDENVMNRILCIESSAQPDLIVEDIWVDPDPPIAGASNRISYRIKNQGGGDAVGTFRTNRYFDGALDEHADTSGLTAGSTKTYYKDMTWPSDSNLHAIKAITDVNGAISESNAGNNERSESFSAECSTPDAPTLTSPGTSSEPGEGIDTLTPTFRWQAVSGADQYGLYISKYPYGSSNIVYENEAISGSSTSLPLPSGYLQDGVKYRWNMRAHNSAGWSSYGIEDGKTRLYFWVNIVPPNRVKGIDVSEYQENINWPTVYDSGYRFAFARASLGDENPPTLIDDYFETNMENGHAAGMLMGAYHFAYPNYGTEASSEARHFLNVAGEYLKEGYLRPVLDLEQGEELGKEALSNWVHEWMNTVKSETGIEPIIYVNSNYANNYLDSSVIQYDLWIAHWRCDTGTPPNTGIWNDWDFWQYYSPDHCGVNSVPGISGGVDLDIFNGDMDRLYTFVIEVCCGNMGVNPTSWSTTINCGDSDNEIVTVSATGGTVKGVTVGKISGPTWLSVSQTDLGDIAAGSSKTFTITASPPSETSGDFPYTVRVSNTCGTPSTRDVTGTITVYCPELSYSPTSHDFGDMCEGVTDSTTFEIWNSGTGTLTYSLSESCGWVDVNPASGSSTGEHDTITVDIDTTGLSEGLHTCDISIGSNGGSGTFTVTVNVVPCEEPVLSYLPTSHDFGDMCEGETDSTTFEIWNSGTGTLTYSLSESCGWMDVNPTSGSSTGEHDTITVDIDTTGLSEGPHTCDISISSNGGSGTFTVTVNVVPCEEPVLSYLPTSHDFGDMCEGETDSTTFEIWNSGTGTLTYSLSESCGWMDVNPTSGSSTGEHDTITVDIDTTGLSEGPHTCDISISSNGGSGTFTVTVNIVAPTGSISVTSSPSGANIYLDGSFIGGQTPYTITNVPAGVHTIGLSLAGYQDWSTNVQVTAGETSYVHATLIPISTTAPIAIFRNGRWFVDTTGNQKTNLCFWYGTTGDKPVVGDFNDDGSDDYGVFRNGRWYIDTTGNQKTNLCFWYGTTGDKPVVGDFNGDTKDDYGVFRNGRWYIDTTGNRKTDLCFWYGTTGDEPVVGDFNGDTKDDYGVFRNGRWHIDTTGNQKTNLCFWYGTTGDEPVVGDFNGDGSDDYGVFRNGRWYIDTTGNRKTNLCFWYGTTGDKPVVGDVG